MKPIEGLPSEEASAGEAPKVKVSPYGDLAPASQDRSSHGEASQTPRESLKQVCQGPRLGCFQIKPCGPAILRAKVSFSEELSKFVAPLSIGTFKSVSSNLAPPAPLTKVSLFGDLTKVN